MLAVFYGELGVVKFLYCDMKADVNCENEVCVYVCVYVCVCIYMCACVRALYLVFL